MILLIENNKVVGTATESYAGPMQYISAPEDFDINLMQYYIYVDNVLILPWKEINKDQAKSLLESTDWTCTVDINNPEYSNPYLINQDAFLAYRSQVRAIAVNPPTIPAVFPEKPQEIWSS